MNLQRRCRKCGHFFPVKPMELKFFCDKKECQEYLLTYHFYTIKSNRHVPLDYFDIFDLDRPIKTGYGYERVCRQCGAPLHNINGKYSPYRRYCANHNGYELFVKYNWGEVSKDYARKVRDDNKELISTLFIEYINRNQALYKEKPSKIKMDLNNLTICEECGKLCHIHGSWSPERRFDVLNIHHKIPVHTLKWDNIHLIWDASNLIALCHDCHKNQDHQLKKPSPYQYQNIISYL